MNCPTKIKKLKKISTVNLNFMWNSFKNKLTVNCKFSSGEAGAKFLLSLRYSSVQSTFLPKKLMKESLLLLSESTTTEETATEKHPGHTSLSFSLTMYWIMYMHRRKMCSALLHLKRKWPTFFVPTECRYIVSLLNNLSELTFSNSVYLSATH